MGAPSVTWRSRKGTFLDSVAECSLTGTRTSPNAIVPFHRERGIAMAIPTIRPDRLRVEPNLRLKRTAQREKGPAHAGGTGDYDAGRTEIGRPRGSLRGLRERSPKIGRIATGG